VPWDSTEARTRSDPKSNLATTARFTPSSVLLRQRGRDSCVPVPAARDPCGAGDLHGCSAVQNHRTWPSPRVIRESSTETAARLIRTGHRASRGPTPAHAKRKAKKPPESNVFQVNRRTSTPASRLPSFRSSRGSTSFYQGFMPSCIILAACGPGLRYDSHHPAKPRSFLRPCLRGYVPRVTLL